MKTTNLFHQASNSFAADIEGVQYTIGRLTEIQSELSRSIDQALADMYALFEPQRTVQRDLSSYGGQVPPEPQTPLQRDPGAFASLPQILEKMRQNGQIKR